MATLDSTGSDAAGTNVNHWSDDRIHVASQATHQIESLLYALRREVNRAGAVDTTLMTTVVNRIKELNSVAMSLLDDDDLRETHEMERVVFGSWIGEEQ